MDASGCFGVTDEAEVGIFSFVCSDFVPIGGRIKEKPEDFLVWEIRLDGSVVRPPVGGGEAPAETPGADASPASEVLEPPRHGRRWAGEGGLAPAAESAEEEEDDGDEAPCRQVAPDGQWISTTRNADGSICTNGCFLKFVLWKRCVDTLEALGALAGAMGVPVGMLGFAGIKDSVAATCQEVTMPQHLAGAGMWPGLVRARVYGSGLNGTRDKKENLSLVTPELVRAAAKEVGEHIRVGGFSLSDSPLWPGRLKGNRFRILVRSAAVRPLQEPSSHGSAGEGDAAKASPGAACSCGAGRKRRRREGETSPGQGGARLCLCEARLPLRHAIQSVRRRGFINYIGMQRFGKGGVRSDLVGLAYFQRDYERCVDLILFGPPEGGSRGASRRPSNSRPPEPKWAAAFRRTWSAEAALNAMPDYGCSRWWVERRLLQALRYAQRDAAEGDDGSGSMKHAIPWYEQCRRAFLKLPRGIRMLYGFSYLDRLWNLCASERAAMGLDAPIAGDLIRPDPESMAVRVLEPHEVSQFSIFDVVLPRAGRNVTMPNNAVGKLMLQYLSYDLDGGLEDLLLEMWPAREPSSEDPEVRSGEKTWIDDESCNEDSAAGNGEESYEEGYQAMETSEWPVSGDYRHLLCRPGRLRWSLRPEAEASPNGDCPAADLQEVTLTFDLPRGTYATMFLRELMRPRGRRPCAGARGGAGAAAGGGSARRHVVWSSDDEEAVQTAGDA